MRAVGRFPIPDQIRITKEHPRNDEDIILRADSLIDSAYGSDIRYGLNIFISLELYQIRYYYSHKVPDNSADCIPGIQAPIHSEVSMNEVDLCSSTDEEEEQFLGSTLLSDEKQSLGTKRTPSIFKNF